MNTQQSRLRGNPEAARCAAVKDAKKRARALVALAVHALAHKLAVAAQGLGADADLLFRRLLVRAAQFHFTENTLALHLLLERAQSLINIAVADGD